MKISDIATLLGVSSKTIYRKIDKLGLVDKGHIKQENSIKTVTNEGFELIKKSVTQTNVKGKMSKSTNVKENVKGVEQHITESYQQIIDFQAVTFRETISNLTRQLKEKDELIDDLRKDKDRLMQMQENSQVLLVREQERVLMLEENKGFWSKFKKKQPS